MHRLGRLLARLVPKRARARKTSRQKTGEWGERIASEYLKGKGYSIVGRRVRPNASNDEIDVIARTGKTLVFVEVKTRRNESFGRPASAVDARKRRALCRGASAFLRRGNYPDFCYRFDIVEVVGSMDSTESPIVRHLEDAFRFPLRYRFPVHRR